MTYLRLCVDDETDAEDVGQTGLSWTVNGDANSASTFSDNMAVPHKVGKLLL